MVIGQVEEKDCPVCNSNAKWQNRDTSWMVDCPMCERYLIKQNTVLFLQFSIVRRVEAGDLLKLPHGSSFMLTNRRIAEFAKERLPKTTFDEHFPGYNQE